MSAYAGVLLYERTLRVSPDVSRVACFKYGNILRHKSAALMR